MTLPPIHVARRATLSTALACCAALLDPAQAATGTAPAPPTSVSSPSSSTAQPTPPTRPATAADLRVRTPDGANARCLPRNDAAFQTAYALDNGVSLHTDHRCPGGPYLVDSRLWRADQPLPLLQLVDGWWVHDVVNAVWVDEAETILRVQARYITGIGPTGTRPFSVEVVAFRQPDGQWRAETPRPIEPGLDVPRQLDHGLLQASSPEQLRLLGLQGPDGSPLALPRPVDFDHWRLLVLPLPPQPARLATPRVERRAKAYRLSYTTMARADQQPAVPHVVWWLLPRDDREVELKQSPYIAAKKPVAPSRWFQSGVLREAQVRFSHRGERW